VRSATTSRISGCSGDNLYPIHLFPYAVKM
jgi:hypothetical protein